AGSAKRAFSTFRLEINPDLVGVSGPLGERMAHADGADDYLDEVRLARLQRREGGTQLRQLAVDGSSLLDAKQVDAEFLVLALGVGAAQELGVLLDRSEGRLDLGSAAVRLLRDQPR